MSSLDDLKKIRCVACRTAALEADALRRHADEVWPTTWQFEDYRDGPRARPVWIFGDGSEVVAGEWISVDSLPVERRGRFRLYVEILADALNRMARDYADLAKPKGGTP